MSQRLSVSHASVSNPPTPVVRPSTIEDNDPTSASKRGSVWQWVVGCGFLVCVAIIWNFSSVLIQYIFNDLSFEAPFFLTSFGMALFSVNLPIYYVTKVWFPQLGRGLSGQGMSDLPQVKAEAGAEVQQTPHDKATLRRTIIAAAVVAPLWFIANFTYNESLNLTSVTSSTILSATSSIFTLILAVWILKERFTWLKALGVLLCMAGNCTTLAKDSTGGISEGFWGDVCALIGAIMYGVYTTAIRKYIPDDAGMSVSLFFGFVGLFSLIVLAVFVIVFNYTGVESLHNLTWEIVGLLFVQGLLNNVLADYLWAVAIMYTSTTTATIGLSLTVPMAIFSDWIVNDIKPGWATWVSSVLVLGGFVVLALTTRKEQLSAGNEPEHETSSSAAALSPQSPATGSYTKIFVTMDVMMNMTTEDVRRLRGQFTGTLGLEAFVWLMKRSLRDRIHSELDFVVGVIELFHTIDVNGDAVLDWDEFAGYMMDAGQAKADFYFEGPGISTKHYVPLSILPADTKTPLRNLTARIQQMRLLTEQNAMAYFEANSDVVYVYGLQFDHNDGPKHLSTMRLHTAFQEHIVLDVVYVAARKSLVTSSVLVRGYLSVWSVTDLYNPVMTHRLESFAAQENLCWVPSLKSMATSAVVIPMLHSGKPSDSKRDCYRPNADTDQPHTKISELQLWDLSGKLRAPANGTIATKEVTVVEERVKGVTALVAFRSINRTYLAVGREDGILSVVDTETGQEVGAFDAHGSGVKVLIYSNEVESFATVGFHSYADETSLHISTWKKSSLGGMLMHDTTLRQHQAPVEILAFVDSNHQLVSVDRTETFNVYSSVVRTPTSEPWECLQTFQYSSPPTSNWHLPQKLWSMFVVPETSASDPVLVTAGTTVKFYDYCEVKPREEIVFACYCSALNVVVGATCTKLLLWKGDTGGPWKTYEYAVIIMSTNDPAASMKQTNPESREAQARAITAVCVDDRERKIIIGDDTGSIKVLNAVNGNVMKELDPHSHCIVDVSYVLYGKRVLSISSNSVLHISDENNPQGFYVPFGGGPIQSVLLQSLRLLPEVDELQQPSIDHSCRPKSPAKYVILRSTGNEALNLVAVLVANPLGDSFIQLWNFDVSHSQGTCVAPESCGEITCLSFFGSTADIVGGTSTGRVFLWSAVPGTTSYRCISELSTATEKDRPHAGITHVNTVCAPDTNEASSNRPTMKERLELEHQCGVHVVASDEAGFVTQWHVRRSSQQVVTFSKIARTLSRPSSGTGQARGRVGLSTDTAPFQHEEMAINFDSIEALYHHARLKSSTDTSLSKTNELLENTAVIDVIEANRQWSAHSGSVLSLEVATDPVAVITSSASGQIKLWGIDGEPHGVLDHFATRRAPLDHPWTFPVDMAARRQQREKEAKELLHRPPGSAYRNGLKERVSVLQERLSLTNSELTFTHQRPRSRKANPRRSEVGRAVRNFILAQTTSRAKTKRKKPPSSAFKEINQDASSLHSVLRELDQFQLHTGSSECFSDRTDSRAKKYSMVTLADFKASVFRPRKTSTVHCDLSSLQDTNNQLSHSQSNPVNERVSVAPDKRRELYITSAPTPDDKMKVVEFLWQGEARGNQETISDSNVAKPKERRQTRDADGVLRYHVKMAHTWQPYLKR